MFIIYNFNIKYRKLCNYLVMLLIKWLSATHDKNILIVISICTQKLHAISQFLTYTISQASIFTFIFLDGEIWIVDHFWKKTVQEIMSIFGIIFVHGTYCLNDLKHKIVISISDHFRRLPLLVIGQ